MNEKKDIKRGSTTAPKGVDDAVGLPETKWFIAIVNNRSEKDSAKKLAKLGIESYVPTQKVFNLWKNGKKAEIEKIIIPSIVFIHCTEQRRKEIINLPFIFRFMTNKAGYSTSHQRKPLAVVSDKEINQLKFMLGQSDIPAIITDRPYKIGDRVKVIRGSLAGLEGEVFDSDASKSEVMVALEHFGCAKLLIDTINLEVIHRK